MKLIYIANVRLPTEKAYGVQITKMCEAFSNQGLEIELIIPWRFNKIKEDIFNYYEIKNNFKIKKLPSLDLIPLNIPRICFWIQGLTFGLFAFFYLIFKKADVIYSRDSFSLFSSNFLKKNFVYEAHTFPEHFFLHRRVFRKARAIIVITQKLKDLFVQKGIPDSKILVAPDGVDIKQFKIQNSKFKIREKLGLPQDKKIVLYTGHLYKWKGAAVLLQAARNFQFSIFNFQNILFVFVGGTEKDIKSFKTQVADLKLKNILVVGYRSYLEIPYWLKAADVLVLPNSGQEKISQYWTSPMKMFEYMASQKPIVASDLPSLREILDENNAILVEPDSPKNLAQGIKQALKNPDFSAKISLKSLKDVQKYSWSNRVKKIIDFI